MARAHPVVVVSLTAFACVMAGSCKTTAEALPKWDEQSPDGAGEVAAHDDQAAQEAELAEASESQPQAPDAGARAEGGTADAGTPSAPAAAPAQTANLELPAPVHKKVNSSCGGDPGVGQRLKSFSLKTPDGKAISPGKYRGRVLLVNFWGTWCKPCLKELPEFDRLYRRYRKHGLTLVAIATDEDPEPVQEFKQRRKLAAKLAIGGESYANQYQSDKFPFSFVVDTRGVIKSSYRGYKPECAGKLEADIRKELEKRAASRK